MIPIAAQRTIAVAVHPYQSMFGPSPDRGPLYPQTRRLVAGWNVNKGQLKNWTMQSAAPDVENATANASNFAEIAEGGVEHANFFEHRRQVASLA
jgi:hypothetical protein